MATKRLRKVVRGAVSTWGGEEGGGKEDEPEGDERDADAETTVVGRRVVGAENLRTDGGTAVGGHLRERGKVSRGRGTGGVEEKKEKTKTYDKHRHRDGALLRGDAVEGEP